ncbi:hypothetical protein [Streptosporangium sp. NPDC006007]|uniref:hypothetical protein n=1 Tax=Streptosporangium sp. NPDC006007 TaxID=3154575 RepID=UPI0033A7DF41
MNGFLGEIGKKLAERWATLLALPGFLYMAVATAAHTLGWGHALDMGLLSRRIDQWARNPSLQSAGGAMLIVVAVLAGSVAVGLASATLGRLVSHVWTLPGGRPPASWVAQWRRGRSRRAKSEADDPGATPDRILAAIDRADRVCLVEADRPTWVGDRLRACRIRVEHAYGLDLDAVWPRLWLLVPDSTRTEIAAARDAYSASARLMGWALLYLLLTIWWWPAALIGVIVGVTAQIKARDTTGVLADLLESTVDLHVRELATRLGHPDSGGPLTCGEGRTVSVLTRKSRWDPASPLAD